MIPALISSISSSGLGPTWALDSVRGTLDATHCDETAMGSVSSYVRRRIPDSPPEPGRAPFADALPAHGKRDGRSLPSPAGDASPIAAFSSRSLLQRHSGVACMDWSTAEPLAGTKQPCDLFEHSGVHLPVTAGLCTSKAYRLNPPPINRVRFDQAIRAQLDAAGAAFEEASYLTRGHL